MSPDLLNFAQISQLIDRSEMTVLRSLIITTIISSILFSCSTSSIKKHTSESLEAIHLPDNSIALLNKNSSISFDTDFDERIVTQTGEVFYIVKEGISPFTVITEKGRVVVLGTEFNVKSSAEELEVEVEKGIVKLKAWDAEKSIHKGQKALVKEVEKGIKLAKAEFNYKAWTNDLNRELDKLLKEIDKGSRQLEKETKKIGKDINKELKKLTN